MCSSYPNGLILSRSDIALTSWYQLLASQLPATCKLAKQFLRVNQKQDPLTIYMHETGAKGTIYEHMIVTDYAMRIILADKKKPDILDHLYVLKSLRKADRVVTKINKANQQKERLNIRAKRKRSYRP
jgi:hypothetical protein